MKTMDYKKIISESWQYTQKNKKLIRWLGFFPSLFTTTFGAGYVAYQFFSFKGSHLFSETDKSFAGQVISYMWAFLKSNTSWTVPLIIGGIIFFVFWFLFPTLAKAAAIQKISRNRSGQKAGVGAGLRHGLLSFLPLFEYHLLIKTFAFFSVMTEISFSVRNLPPSIFTMLLPFFVLFVIASFVLTLLFTYADFYIVIDEKGVFDSMKMSAKLVITNWTHTLLISILMIIIGIRIVIQAILVFLIPALVVLISGYLATVALATTGIIVGGIVGLIVLVIAAYLNGIVDIFAYTVWTFTFLKLSSAKQPTAREMWVDDAGEGSGDNKPFHADKEDE